ncbi:MAG: alpha-galactosidase [Gammaproteobacteria bacterium]|nr:alpha-galactosidase [Gammaproteobacteria bacterium]
MSTTRRQFLALGALAGVAARAGAATAEKSPSASAPAVAIEDGTLRLEFDARLDSRITRLGPAPTVLTDWDRTEGLTLADQSTVEDFMLAGHETTPLEGAQGRGRRLRVSATSAQQVRLTMEVTLLERYPGMAFLSVRYRNESPNPLKIAQWSSTRHTLLAAAGDAEPAFWCYCGSTHEDRRDWVQPMRPNFRQDNFMGMTATDYGGGTPVVDVWRRDAGLAVGHLELTPRLLTLPLERRPTGATLGISARLGRTLAPGETLELPALFLSTHAGDYFATLTTYRQVMADRGIAFPDPPPPAFESIWCAWGYERECTAELIKGTLPKVRELGLKWAVVDDGWQSNVGDWQLHPAKYPRGDADMQDLVRAIRAQGLRARLWFAPLMAPPGSDLLHDHTDLLLLDKDGAPQMVSWWNAFYLCPAYAPTVAFTRALVQRFIGGWGYEGLKVDGQHLNAVAPCYNPAHRHARPEESVEGLQAFMLALYQSALQANAQSVFEWCPCGTGFSYFNFPAMNQAPASDPESSWQVRHKGKTLKALMGPHAAYAGDHVELSDGGDDFASTVGIGAIVSTKFTWPRDPKPKDSFLLTPERERWWRHWIGLYNTLMLSRGRYRGELYDLGFDRPETHAIEKDGVMYYACYAPRYSGPLGLRGLAPGPYRVRDYFNDRVLGEVRGPNATLEVRFERFLVLEARRT